MGKKPCKRPASKPASDAPHGFEKKPRVIDFAPEMSMVAPEETVKLLCEAAGLVRTSKMDKLAWASAFDGTNMPDHTLGFLKVPSEHMWGSEKAVGPAYFCLSNSSMLRENGHLYQDFVLDGDP